ncbi:DNA/RNA non-specific endonuclease [Streptomyces yangpuensis]
MALACVAKLHVVCLGIRDHVALQLPHFPPDQQEAVVHDLGTLHSVARDAEQTRALAQANKDSFHYTNITPQMEDFNQSSKRGVWGQLEDALFAEVEVDNLKVSAFGGPIFQEDDRFYRDAQISREFFKVLAYVEQGQLKAKAFLLTQNLNQLEALELDGSSR